MTMANIRTRAGSSPVDFALKNNTAATAATATKDLDLVLETDTGLLATNNNGTYCRSAPRSTLTVNSIPKCSNATTGLLTDSLITSGVDSSGTVAVNYVAASGFARESIKNSAIQLHLTVFGASAASTHAGINLASLGIIHAVADNSGMMISQMGEKPIYFATNETVRLTIGGTGDVTVSNGDLVIAEGKGLYFCASGTDKASTGTIRMTKSGK
jgi:hypothetical protein